MPKPTLARKTANGGEGHASDLGDSTAYAAFGASMGMERVPPPQTPPRRLGVLAAAKGHNERAAAGATALGGHNGDGRHPSRRLDQSTSAWWQTLQCSSSLTEYRTLSLLTPLAGC